MIRNEIKHPFNQLITGLEAFVGNFELKLQNIFESLPVFILETGDTTYYFDKKFIISENNEIYEKVPRFVMSINSVQPQLDQNSNQYNKFEYHYENNNYTSIFRRITNLVNINGNFVSSNFIQALQNYEVLCSILSRENVFTYEHLGNTFEGNYILTINDIEKPPMDIGSNSRNSDVKVSIDVYLYPFIVRPESIVNSDSRGFDSVQVKLTAKDKINGDHTEDFDVDFLLNN